MNSVFIKKTVCLFSDRNKKLLLCAFIVKVSPDRKSEYILVCEYETPNLYFYFESLLPVLMQKTNRDA